MGRRRRRRGARTPQVNAWGAEIRSPHNGATGECSCGRCGSIRHVGSRPRRPALVNATGEAADRDGAEGLKWTSPRCPRTRVRRPPSWVEPRSQARDRDRADRRRLDLTASMWTSRPGSEAFQTAAIKDYARSPPVPGDGQLAITGPPAIPVTGRRRRLRPGTRLPMEAISACVAYLVGTGAPVARGDGLHVFGSFLKMTGAAAPWWQPRLVSLNGVVDVASTGRHGGPGPPTAGPATRTCVAVETGPIQVGRGRPPQRRYDFALLATTRTWSTTTTDWSRPRPR